MKTRLILCFLAVGSIVISSLVSHNLAEASSTSKQIQPVPEKNEATSVINVLQVYPDGHNTVVVAQGILAWASNFHIDVLPITSLNNCNSYSCMVSVVDPLTSLASTHPISYYDVLYFGGADQYGGRDLSLNGVQTVRSFAMHGKGLVFTHDTISTWEQPGDPVYHPNFCSLSDVTGLTCIPPGQGVFLGGFTSVTRVSSNTSDPIMNVPFVLPATFPVVYTHFYGQIIAQGTRWYDGNNGGNAGLYMHSYHNPTYGSNSAFYSYGHSESVPLEWEAKGMINSMYYSYHGSGYSISGRIMDYGNTPIPGVTLNVGSNVAISDSDGYYFFSNLAGGDYTIVPNKTGYTFNPAMRNISLQANVYQVNFSGFTSPSSFSISGTVTGVGGNGVVISDGAGHSTTTNAAGGYTLSGLPAGTYTITPSKDGYSFSPSTFSFTVPPSRNKDFTGQENGCAGVNFNRKPVFLVTGWGGSAQSLSDDENLTYVKDYLSSLGYKETCNLFYAESTSPYLDLNANAETIRDNLCKISLELSQKNPAWDGHMDIIGHSYGGLRARAFIENPTFYDDTCPGLPRSSYKVVKIDHLITVGSPHGGEWGDLPLSYLIGLNAVIFGQYTAAWEITPWVRDNYNSTHHQPEGVSYYLISGDAREQSNYDLWPFPTVRNDPNDFAVHQWSAHALSGNLNYPRVYRMYTHDVHGVSSKFVSWLYDLSSYFHPISTFNACIWPIIQSGTVYCQSPLTQMETPPPVSSFERFDAYRQQHTYEGAPMMSVQAGALAQNDILSGTFEMYEAGQSQVNLYWGSGDVHLSLVDPDGNLIQPNDPGVTMESFDTGFGLVTSYEFEQIKQGIWSYTLSANDLPTPVVYDIFATMPLPITLEATLASWFPNNESVPITVRVLFNNTDPLVGGSVSAEIQRPGNESETINLFDDGLHQDGAANDGVFGIVYTKTSQGGNYGILFTAVGNYQNQGYKRTVLGAFSVASDKAVLGTQYDSYAIDDDQDGLYERLNLSVPVTVTQASNFTVSAELYAGSMFIEQTSIDISLSSGDWQVELSFDGSIIFDKKADGPYTIRNVILLEKTQPTILIQTQDNVYTTGAYQYLQFGTHTFPLSISKSGMGIGTVTSSPAGINCGTTCSASFNYNTVVTLTATPISPSTFGGWSGGGCSGTGTCTITMNAARSVTALFTGTQPSLPDLQPHAPTGYPSPVVPSSIQGTHEVNTLYTGARTFFDWHFINSGNAAASGNFYLELWMDDTRYVRYPFSNFMAGWVDGVDDWAETILAPGWHTVKLIVDPDNTIIESDETNNIWTKQFYWQPITGWKGEYFNNKTLDGNPWLTRDDFALNFNWLGEAPDPSLDAENFSARWTRTAAFPAGNYRFHMNHDDGARLFVDDILRLDKWDTCCTWDTVDITLSGGNHTVRMEMFENGGWTYAALWWERLDISGWRGEYYNNETLNGNPVIVRDDPAVNFDWGAGSPDPMILMDHFSARWTRSLEFAGETYIFHLRHDDGARLYIDNALVLNVWTTCCVEPDTVQIQLQAGRHTIRLEMDEVVGYAYVRLWWESSFIYLPLVIR